MQVFDTLDDLVARMGEEVAVSDWFTVTQQHIDAFADATEDHQWIHVDPQRARGGPFGRTIAHGFLTLALSVYFADRSIRVRNVRMVINYGLNRVRFVSPVPVGSRLRARMVLAAAKPLPDGQQLLWHTTIERAGGDKPACVLEQWFRYSTAAAEGEEEPALAALAPANPS